MRKHGDHPPRDLGQAGGPVTAAPRVSPIARAGAHICGNHSDMRFSLHSKGLVGRSKIASHFHFLPHSYRVFWGALVFVCFVCFDSDVFNFFA